MHKKAVGFQ